jgi:hypothetical protein
VVAFFGELNKGSAIFQNTAQAILAVANNIDVFGRIVLGGALAAGLATVLSLLLKIGRIKQFAIGSAILFASTQLLAFADRIRVVQGETTTLADFFTGLATVVGDEFRDSADQLGSDIKDLFATFDTDIDQPFRTAVFKVASRFDQIIDFAKGTVAAIGVIFAKLPDILDAAFSKTNQALADELQERADNLTEVLNRTGAGADALFPGARERIAGLRQEIIRLREAASPLETELKETFDGVKIAIDKTRGSTTIFLDTVKRAFNLAGARAADREAREEAERQVRLDRERRGESEALTKARIAFLEVERKINQQTKIATATTAERRVLAETFRIEEQLRKRSVDVTDGQVQAEIRLLAIQIRQNVELRRRQDIVNRLRDAQQKRTETLEVLIDALRRGEITEQQFGQAADRNLLLFRDFNLFLTTELQKGLQQTIESLTDLSGLVSGTIVGALDRASSALADFALSGFKDVESLKEAFSNLFADLARDITKFIIRLIVLKTLSTILAPSFGGLSGETVQATGGPAQSGVDFVEFGGLGPAPGLPGRQAGGFLARGQAGIVGERGPELFVPQTSGRVVPNGQIGGAPQVTVTPIIVDDPDLVANFLATEEGADSVVAILQRRRRQLKGVV